MDYVAAILDMAPIRVYEVATFYTMFNLKPVGSYLLQVCRTTPCWLRGSDELSRRPARASSASASRRPRPTASSPLVEVECLGACVNAPVVQINDDFYEDLDRGRSWRRCWMRWRRGEPLTPGSQTGRQGSAPDGGPTTLRELTPAEE